MANAGAPTRKGWVRDGILSSLAKRPRTASEIAEELGVSKATVSYHTKALVRRDVIEIADVKSVRGGVYSKTFVLRPGSLVLVRRRTRQEDSLAKLDELFEKLLLSWHLKPEREPADEVKLFLYHAFRILADADALEEGIFEGFGERVAEELIVGSLNFDTLKKGLRELVAYMGEQRMAEMRAEPGKGEARLVCTGCFENDQHGGLVCAFTKGIVEGIMRARRGTKYSVERRESEEMPACVFTVRWGRLAS